MSLSCGFVLGAIHAASLAELSEVAADKVLARGRDAIPGERTVELEGTLLVDGMTGNELIGGLVANWAEGGGVGRGVEGGGPLDNFSEEEGARCNGAGRFIADAFGNAL